eukprot:CCRYP_005692-RB/>CCRYP_005692-RB protein AED:0.49 eAED:1.00 QI:0/0/0/1/0/0/2/0/88
MLLKTVNSGPPPYNPPIRPGLLFTYNVPSGLVKKLATTLLISYIMDDIKLLDVNAASGLSIPIDMKTEERTAWNMQSPSPGTLRKTKN